MALCRSPRPNLRPKSVHRIPVQSFMESLAVNLDPKAAAEVNQIVGMIFPDAREAFTIHVRHGVAEIRLRSIQDLEQHEPGPQGDSGLLGLEGNAGQNPQPRDNPGRFRIQPGKLNCLWEISEAVRATDDEAALRAGTGVLRRRSPHRQRVSNPSSTV